MSRALVVLLAVVLALPLAGGEGPKKPEIIKAKWAFR